jgi:hypothetical protein
MESYAYADKHMGIYKRSLRLNNNPRFISHLIFALEAENQWPGICVKILVTAEKGCLQE